MIAVRGLAAALIAMQFVLAGCSTQQIARFETKVATSRCSKSGLADGTLGHRQCVAANLAAAQQEKVESRAILLGAASAGTGIWAAEQQARARAAASPTIGATAIYSLRSDALQNWEHICRYTDGTVINSGKESCPSSITGRK